MNPSHDMENKYMAMAKKFFGKHHPLFNAMGVKIEEIEQGRSVMSMPCSSKTCNHKGALHSGAITTLLDTDCGMAIFSRIGDMRPIATIDLRVDFLAEVPVGEGVRAEVECYAIRGDVAYVKGVALAQSDRKLLASVSGSFAVGTLGPSLDRGDEGVKDE